MIHGSEISFPYRREALIRLSIGVLAALFTVGGAYAQGAAGLVRIGGTGSGSVLLQRLAGEYRKTAPEVDFEVVMPALGSVGGLRALAARRIDLAVLGRPPKPGEVRGDLLVTPWAETPLVLASSSGRRSGGFDLVTLAALLRGRRGAWDDGTRINLVLRQPTESDNLLLSGLSPEIREALAVALRNPASTIADTDLDAIDLLNRTPGSLGTTTLGLLRLKDSTLTPLALNGVAPTLQALRQGRYPLGKKLYLAHERELSGPAAAFTAWLQSPAAAAKLQEFEHLALPR